MSDQDMQKIQNEQYLQHEMFYPEVNIYEANEDVVLNIKEECADLSTIKEGLSQQNKKKYANRTLHLLVEMNVIEPNFRF